MDKIRLHIQAVCLVSIFSGLVCALIPQGKLKNAFSAFCAVVIIFSALAPVAEIKTKQLSLFSIKSTEAEQMLLSDVKAAEVSVYESVLASAIEKELEKSGYKAVVSALCEKKAEEISIVSFTVKINASEQEKKDIEVYLKNSFGNIKVNFEVAKSND